MAGSAPATSFISVLDRVSRPVIDLGAVASAPIPSSDAWVGAWGTCIRCAELTPGRLCADCANEEDVAACAAVIYRPTAFVVLEVGQVPDDDDDAHLAVLRLPNGVRRRARQVAEAIARITTARLVTSGWTLHLALRTAALGRDQLAADLAAHGTRMDRKTIGYVLDELADLGVITRTGQLRAWTDPNEQDASRVIKSGAHLWALAVELCALGQAAFASALRVSESLGGNRVRGTRHSRVEGALRWALNAQPGERNRIGHWLACRCRDAGLPEDDADHLMRRYVAGVDQTGHRYDLREAMRTLRSVYRSHRTTELDQINVGRLGRQTRRTAG